MTGLLGICVMLHWTKIGRFILKQEHGTNNRTCIWKCQVNTLLHLQLKLRQRFVLIHHKSLNWIPKVNLEFMNTLSLIFYPFYSFIHIWFRLYCVKWKKQRMKEQSLKVSFRVTQISYYKNPLTSPMYEFV